MSAVEAILSRLDGVQRSGKGWRAKCPACGGHGRKVSIAEGEGGKALVRCFGGCEPLSVTQALGLTLSDLFPERLHDDTPDGRRQARRAARESQWGAALDVLDLEAGVIFIAGQDAMRGQPLSAEDAKRLAVAVKRVGDARSILRDSAPFKSSRASS